MKRVFVPCFIDHHQSATYRVVSWEWTEAGGLVAVFADGKRVPSVHATVDELLSEVNRKGGLHEYVREVES